MGRFTGIAAAAAMIAFGAGQAAAQFGVVHEPAQFPDMLCTQLKELVPSTEAQVTAFGGALKRPASGSAKDVFAATVSLDDMADCEFTDSSVGARMASHQLSCTKTFISAQQASGYIAGAYACLKDVLAERSLKDEWIAAEYIATEMNGSVARTGRNAPTRFSATDYVRVWARTGFRNNSQVTLSLYFNFQK